VHEPRTERVTMMMEKSLVARVDDYRFASRTGSRAGAIRTLIENGLFAQEAKGPVGASTPPSQDHDKSPLGKAYEHPQQ
jgi:hypothetical protein